MVRRLPVSCASLCRHVDAPPADSFHREDHRRMATSTNAFMVCGDLFSGSTHKRPIQVCYNAYFQPNAGCSCKRRPTSLIVAKVGSTSMKPVRKRWKSARKRAIVRVLCPDCRTSLDKEL